MKIIDNKKDFYDYMSSIWGIDDKVVYDRRGSLVLTDVWNAVKPCILPLHDRERKSKTRWEVMLSHNVKLLDKKPFGSTVLEGDVFPMCLEVGFYHYFFVVERYIENEKLEYNVYLSKKEKVEKKVSEAPISLMTYKIHSSWWRKDIVEEIEIDREVKNPIIKGCILQKSLNPEDIWKETYEYLSSLNDKNIIDSRTNKEKIESYGFDNKISFRNVK